MKTNRIVAALLTLVMLLVAVMPGVALSEGDTAEEAAATVSAPAPEPEPEPTARDAAAEEGEPKAVAVEPVAPVAPVAEPAPTAQSDAEQGDGGSSDASGGGTVQPVAPVIVSGPAITPPPESTDAPKPEAELAVQSKEAEVTYTVTFIYMSATGAEQQAMVTVGAGGAATPPAIPLTYSANGKTYSFKRWDKAYNSITANLTVKAEYTEVTTYTPSVDDYYLVNYTGKPSKTVAMQIPIIMTKLDGDMAYSNEMADGSLADRWTDDITPDRFAQDIYTAMKINWLRVQIDTTAISSMPFTSESVTSANSAKRKPYVVQQFVDDPSYYSNYGFQGGSVNRGFAAFDLKVKSSAKNGTYTIPLKVTWNDEEGEHKATFDAYVQISGEKASSSGTSGGSGSTGTTATEKPVPKGRLYIDNVRTDPENPEAGDAFKIILTLINSSKTLYMQNLLLAFSTSDDQLRPAGEATNVIYIPKIDANKKLDIEIPVESAPDIANKLIKMTVQMDFEDKKLAADSVTQDITIPVTPIQKIQVDDPKLPTGTSYVDQEYEIEINVANIGKVVLNNLRADIVADEDQVTLDSFYGGNLEGATSKTVSLSPIPLVAGDIPITVEISYENDIGEKKVVEKKITISASQEEDYGYDPYESTYEPAPEPDPVTPISILSVLPKELYMAAGALVLLIIASMALSARKRRKRAMEDDEMD